MPIYQDDPDPNSTVIAGKRFRFLGILKALWNSSGLRIGDGAEPTQALDVVSPTAPVNIRAAGDSAGLVLRDNSGAVNQKVAQLLVDGNTARLRGLNDAETTQTFLGLSMELATGNINLAEDLTVDGRLEVGGGWVTCTGNISDLVLRIEDGTGRVNLYWNSTGGTTPTFLTGNENAGRLTITTNGFFATYWASGSGKSPGDPISWVPLLLVRDTDITYKGVNIANPAEGCVLDGPPTATVTGGWINLPWTIQVENVGAMHSIGVNPHQVTIPVTGRYSITGNLTRNGIQPLAIRCLRNGARFTGQDSERTGGLASHAEMQASMAAIYRLTAGDVLTTQYNSQTAAAVLSGNFSVVRIGD